MNLKRFTFEKVQPSLSVFGLTTKASALKGRNNWTTETKVLAIIAKANLSRIFKSA